MENIIYYLEAMFAHLPNTEAVLRAKSELQQMMEDKYNELIAEGKTENEAVGTVITEFGNLDELAESLGITTEVEVEKVSKEESPLRRIGLEEAKEFLRSGSKNASMTGLGLFLLISSVIGPILGSEIGLRGIIGVMVMLLMIAGGIIIIAFAGSRQKDWSYIQKKDCYLDLKTTEAVLAEKEYYRSIGGFQKALGVSFIVFCWLPLAILSETDSLGLIARFGSTFLFLFIGIGVGLLAMTGMVEKCQNRLLELNEQSTVAGQYRPRTVQYISKTAEFVLRVFWVTIVCLYLILSFLTFRWELTWILWPIAAVTYVILLTKLRKEC